MAAASLEGRAVARQKPAAWRQVEGRRRAEEVHLQRRGPSVSPILRPRNVERPRLVFGVAADQCQKSSVRQPEDRRLVAMLPRYGAVITPRDPAVLRLQHAAAP